MTGQSSSGEGLQNQPSCYIIVPTDTEEVVKVPLYGVVHDSPLITAVQKAVGKRKVIRREADVEYLRSLFAPFISKIQAEFDALEEAEKSK